MFVYRSSPIILTTCRFKALLASLACWRQVRLAVPLLCFYPQIIDSSLQTLVSSKILQTRRRKNMGKKFWLLLQLPPVLAATWHGSFFALLCRAPGHLGENFAAWLHPPSPRKSPSQGSHNRVAYLLSRSAGTSKKWLHRVPPSDQ